MFRSFVSTLIPALAVARGTDDGTSRENAHTNWIVKGEESNGDNTYVQLHTWIEEGDDGVWEWRGDISAQFENQRRYIFYGFCQELEGSNKSEWDCMRVAVTPDLTGEDSTNPDQWREIQDFKYSGSQGGFDWDAAGISVDELPNGDPSLAADKAFNWVIDYDNSVINCSESGTTRMDCNPNWESSGDSTNGVKTSWRRNWVTGDADGSDVPILWENAGEKRHFLGFAYTFDSEPTLDGWVKSDYSRKTWSGTNQFTVPIPDSIVDDELQFQLNKYGNDLKFSHSLFVEDDYDYTFPLLEPSFTGSDWEYSVSAKDGEADFYPSAFMTLDEATHTLQFRPGNDEQYGDKTWTLVLSVSAVDSPSITADYDMEVKVTNHPHLKMTYTVAMTDNAAGFGQIKFSLPVNMVWLETNFDDFFAAYLLDADTHAPLVDDLGLPVDAGVLFAITFDSNEDGMVVDFSIPTFDVSNAILEVDVEMDYADYGAAGALFIVPSDAATDTLVELDTLAYDVDIPDSTLTYTVEITDATTGEGEIVFSHAIDMVWLEEHFFHFFTFTLVEDATGLVETDVPDFEVTKYHDSGLQVDFTVGEFEVDTYTMNVGVDTDFAYSGLFVSSVTDASFVLGNTSASVIEAEQGGLVLSGDLNLDNVDLCDDDDEDKDGAILFLLILVIILSLCLIFCCVWFIICPCCRKRQLQAGETAIKKTAGDSEMGNRMK